MDEDTNLSVTLLSPSGEEYETSSPTEITQLRSMGYRDVDLDGKKKRRSGQAAAPTDES